MSEEKAPYIFVNDVSFRYSDSKILENVSLNIAKNEFCLLIGPNGGGKTTLVKLIMGLLTPQSGRISIDGKSPEKMRLAIGYVPQALQFDPQFPISVGEFVMLGGISKLSWFGKRPKDIKVKAQELLEQVGLGNFFHAAFGSLSGGQKQRATLMRALLNDPDILILDEPINNLDAESSELFYGLIDKHKGNKTIVMITHFVGDLFEKADSIYVVNHTISKIEKEKACSHYPMGLYHLHGEDR